MKLNYYTRQKIIIGILLSCIILLEVVYIFSLGELIAGDVEYSEIQTKLQQEKEANLKLKETLLEQQSLLHIEQVARREGFVHPTYIYLH